MECLGKRQRIVKVDCLAVHLAIIGIPARMDPRMKIPFQPGACSLDARMIEREAACEQGAKSVRGRAAVGRETVATVAILAGRAGFVPNRIIVNEEKAPVVEGGISQILVVGEILTALDKNQCLAEGR